MRGATKTEQEKRRQPAHKHAERQARGLAFFYKQESGCASDGAQPVSFCFQFFSADDAVNVFQPMMEMPLSCMYSRYFSSASACFERPTGSSSPEERVTEVLSKRVM